MNEFFLVVIIAVFAAPIVALLALGSLVNVRKRVQKLESQLHALQAQFSYLREQQARAGQAPQDQTVSRESAAPVQTVTIQAQPPAPVSPIVEPPGPSMVEPPVPPAVQPVSPPPRPFEPRPDIEELLAARRKARESEEAPEPPRFFNAETKLAPAPAKVVDWEKFLGVKLFAWVGGLALFLGIAFFVKYSFERNLISPEMRIALGYVTAIGLVIGGVVMRRKEYAVTSQTLCATGVVALYGVSFAAHGLYHLLGTVPVFALMSLVTVTAFTLAVRMNAQVIAILGLLGGFLTPPLLSASHDSVTLFGYALLLNIGLISVALYRKWEFLILLGAICTGLTELARIEKSLEMENAIVPLMVFTLFNAVFLGAFILQHRKYKVSRLATAAVFIQALLTFAVASKFISTPELAARPWLFLTLVFVADAAILAMLWWNEETFELQLLSGTGVFVLLAYWVQGRFWQQHLFWALGATLLFGLMHSVLPLVLQRRRNLRVPVLWANAFPLVALVTVMLLLMRMETVSLLVWPAILLLDLLVIGLALVTGTVAIALGAILLTALITGTWILRLPLEWSSTGTVFIIGSFALLFVGAGLFLTRKLGDKLEGGEEPPGDWLKFIPALAALLPFLLLALMIGKLDTSNPSNIFALALVLDLVLLWLARRTNSPELGAAALGASLFLQFFWHQSDLKPEHVGVGITWYLIFYATFMASAFIRRDQVMKVPLAWAVSALSGPLHFFMIYLASKALLEPFPAMGLVPAMMAVPSLLALGVIVKKFHLEESERFRLMAWFGGSALFFITMIFPIQFDRQWLTLGWALEGVALLWLFRRVPHRGLPVVGVGLLLVVFVRLGLNPNILGYYPRSETPILNWYLYSYGVATACFFLAGKLLDPPRNMVLGKDAQPLMFTLGTVLAFMLLNIEIADFFGTSTHLQFEFSGNFARDMTYSIAWALFGLVLLVVGIRKQIAAVRYASLGLLGATLLKLFLHDLRTLDAGYRIGAFIGVAIVLITASWAYQRYLASLAGERKSV